MPSYAKLESRVLICIVTFFWMVRFPTKFFVLINIASVSFFTSI